jgi:hypothetical protein
LTAEACAIREDGKVQPDKQLAAAGKTLHINQPDADARI